MRKQKSPLRHTGKIVPLRTRDDVVADVEREVRSIQNGSTVKPSLDHLRDEIERIKNAEIAKINTPEDAALVKQRLVILAEAMASIEMIESYAKDLPVEIQNDVVRVALIGSHVGKLVAVARLRFMEPYAYEAAEQSRRGTDLAMQKADNGFKITRAELLQKCKDAYRRFRCNQEDLRVHVSTALSGAIGPARVKQKMREHGITKKDYEN